MLGRNIDMEDKKRIKWRLEVSNVVLRYFRATKKYGFAMQHPLSAKALTKARSKAAKKRGLPEKLQKYMEARRQKKAEASKPAATETVTAAKPKRTRLRKKPA